MTVAVAGETASQPASTTEQTPPPVPESVVVVGNGPVGFRFVRGLVERQLNHACRVTVFGEEPRPAYDRVNLTKYLDDPCPDSLQYEPRSWYESHDVRLLTNDPVIRIDRESRTVESRSGRTVCYDRLILATGSRPFMPPVPGIDLEGVFAYRTIEDLSGIRDYAAHAKRAVVLGGGLLGLEAAQAMKKLKLSVFVVEMAPVLMPRQLDKAGATLLQKLIQATGLRVLTQRQTERITRVEEGLHVQFAGGESVVADMVVVSAGIRPRDELARDCELPVGERGGIVVNSQLETEDPSICAIGECAVHDGTVYGLAAPGFQMAGVLADRLRGREAAFVGSSEATRLKLAGVDVIFSGDYLDTSGAHVLTWETQRGYTKLIIRNGRLVGMIGVGDVPQQERFQEAIDQRRRVYWWNKRRFEATGRLWKGSDSISVASWPPTTVVCSCQNITRGDLTEAQQKGCTSVESLAAATGATTVCGSCRPLVQQFCGQAATVETDRTSLWVAALSVTAMILTGLLIFAPPVELPVSVQSAVTLWQTLILNSFWKQVTGFTVLGLAFTSLVITVRRRTQLLHRFRFTSMRLIHVLVATLSLAGLIAHTGFHRGSNLNFALFCTFIAASLTGSFVGLLAGTETRLPVRFRRLRGPLTFGHILCLWPLPVLVAFHIVSVYWL